MTVTRHTPGPWHWDANEIDKRSRPYVRCNVKLPGAVGNVAVAKVTGEGLEMTANARLIAAAPELLAACELVLSSTVDDEEDYRPVLRAAIAKATGGDK